MANAKQPAPYEVNVTSASVNIGDLIFVYSDGGSISGVTNSHILSYEGYDGGYIEAYSIEEQGTISISTTNYADVLHTGREDAIQASIDTYTREQYGGTGIIATGLNQGDIILQWDEDDHGDTKKDWSFTGEEDIRYGDSTGTVNRRVSQTLNSGDTSKDADTYVEHHVFKINLTIVPDPTNLTATPTNDNTVDLEWECSNDPNSFSIERKRENERYSFLATVDGTNRTYTDDNVATQIPYIYRVWATKPSPSDVTLEKETVDVSIGDLVVIYEDSNISNVSHRTLTKMVGSDGGFLKVFLIEENGTVAINTSGSPDVIHTGSDDISSVDNTHVKLSKEGFSTGEFASLNSGDIIIQWDEDDTGDESGYYSFTGDTRSLYKYEGGLTDRMIKQVFTAGDISRDASSGAEIATIGLDVSPGSVLTDTASKKTNEDDARTGMPQIDVR